MNNKIVNGIVTVVILIVFIKNCFITSESESNINSKSNTEDKFIENSSNVLPFTEEEMAKVREQVDYFENKLKNDFWTKFQQSNKYGKKNLVQLNTILIITNLKNLCKVFHLLKHQMEH